MICVKCERWQNPEVFSAAPRMKRGRHSWCRSCQTSNMAVWLTPEKREARNEQKRSTYDPAAAKARRETNYEHVRRLERKSRLAKKYGMTLEEYDLRSNEQGGACAICKVRADLHVDHCHVTGEVRGLLCRRCNVGLGFFADDIDRVQAAASYLLGQRLKDVIA
jgi:hypothetical protein